MTREEYEKLLKSDYWKGYSYALIKERNFTCEDCGRQFPNERNKLQVHHLVYRDVNPWSYRPDEVIVLCEECHKKRHGIRTDSYPHSDGSMGGHSSTLSSKKNTNEWTSLNDDHSNSRHQCSSKRIYVFNLRYLLYVLLFLFAMLYLWEDSTKQKRTREQGFSEKYENYTDSSKNRTRQNNKSNITPGITSNEESSVNLEEDAFDPNISQSTNNDVIDISNREETRELSTVELLEKRNHEVVVKRAKRAGVDTVGTTLEILERINHADVVNRAKRAGVDTSGTTLEILERMNHADVVNRAKRAGVDTSGTTLEILDRINHADIVNRAKRAGVSTEGTTLEILERINRQELER